MIALVRRLLSPRTPEPEEIDWNARLEADRAERERLIGRPYAKRRAAALKARRA